MDNNAPKPAPARNIIVALNKDVLEFMDREVARLREDVTLARKARAPLVSQAEIKESLRIAQEKGAVAANLYLQSQQRAGAACKTPSIPNRTDRKSVV